MDVKFSVEDGTGRSDATSYVTVDGMKQYWYNIGYEYTDLLDNDIKRLLNKSTMYIDNNYRRGFPGHRQTDTQTLEWPRIGAYYVDYFPIPEDSIPVEVENAVCEMAYLYHTDQGPSSVISKSGKVVAESSQVDVIKESTKYDAGSILYQDIYAIVDEALGRITGGVSDRFVIKALRIAGESP